MASVVLPCEASSLAASISAAAALSDADCAGGLLEHVDRLSRLVGAVGGEDHLRGPARRASSRGPPPAGGASPPRRAAPRPSRRSSERRAAAGSDASGVSRIRERRGQRLARRTARSRRGTGRSRRRGRRPRRRSRRPRSRPGGARRRSPTVLPIVSARSLRFRSRRLIFCVMKCLSPKTGHYVRAGATGQTPEPGAILASSWTRDQDHRRAVEGGRPLRLHGRSSALSGRIRALRRPGGRGEIPPRRRAAGASGRSSRCSSPTTPSRCRPPTRSTGPPSGSATSSASTSGAERRSSSPDYFRDLPSEGDLKWAIRDLLDREINPAVAAHGGFVELIDVKRNNVYLRLGGGCQGCGAADVTLKQGIEKAIREPRSRWSARSSTRRTTPPAATRTTRPAEADRDRTRYTSSAPRSSRGPACCRGGSLRRDAASSASTGPLSAPDQIRTPAARAPRATPPRRAPASPRGRR